MLEKIREFVRPVSTAALVVMLITGAVIAGALEALLPGVGVRFTLGVAGWFRALPTDFYNLLIAALGIYGVARTVEKGTSIYSTAKYSPPARDVTDDMGAKTP